MVCGQADFGKNLNWPLCIIRTQIHGRDLLARKRPVSNARLGDPRNERTHSLGAIIPAFPSLIGNFGKEQSGTDFGKRGMARRLAA